MAREGENIYDEQDENERGGVDYEHSSVYASQLTEPAARQAVLHVPYGRRVLFGQRLCRQYRGLDVDLVHPVL